MSTLVPTCVWRCTVQVVLALDDRFGEPIDAYVNGSQVWLRDDGPGAKTLEWRLHPVARFRRPPGVGTYELFDLMTAALAAGAAPPAPLVGVWDGLECFAAYGDELEPAMLAAACTEALGLAPDRCGLVDHESVGAAWEQTGGATSIIEALLEQLG